MNSRPRQTLGPDDHRLKDMHVHIALLLIRIASGLAFLYHGSAILFGAFGGPGPAKFAASIHVPVAIAYLIGIAQFAGGLAMLTGILVRLGAACIIVVMLGAIFLVHLPHGFDVGKGGIRIRADAAADRGGDLDYRRRRVVLGPTPSQGLMNPDRAAHRLKQLRGIVSNALLENKLHFFDIGDVT
jgi:putative oxidoreductase